MGHKIGGCEAAQTNGNTFLIRWALPIITGTLSRLEISFPLGIGLVVTEEPGADLCVVRGISTCRLAGKLTSVDAPTGRPKSH